MFPDNIFLPDGFNTVKEHLEYVRDKINEMIEAGLNKEETADLLSNTLSINREHTRTAWDYYADMLFGDQATPSNVEIHDSSKEPIVREERKTQDSEKSGETLEQILSAVNKIASMLEQMLKLMTDATAKTGEKQQDKEEKEQEQAENLENQAGKDSTS